MNRAKGHGLWPWIVRFKRFLYLNGSSVKRRISQSKKTVFFSRNLRVDRAVDEESQSQQMPAEREDDISIFKGEIHLKGVAVFQVFKLAFFDI